MFELRTLGLLDLRRPDGTSIRAVLTQPKRATLLVYLAVARPAGFHRRDTLLALLWPESSEEAARHSLSQALHMLRQALGTEIIERRGRDEVGLVADAVWCDAERLLRAESEGRWAEALELYRGEFLAGLNLNGMAELQTWIDAERARMLDAASRAAWSLAGEQMQRGAFTEAERTAISACALSRGDETAARATIGALLEAGASAAALRVYEKLRAVLRNELELEPSRETMALSERLRIEVMAQRDERPAAAPTGHTVSTGENDPREGHPMASQTPSLRSPARETSHLAAQPGRRRRSWITRASAVLLCFVAAVTLSMNRNGDEPAKSGTRSLVVLPFESLSKDTTQQYFVAGMHSALVSELARISALRLVSRTSAIEYDRTGKSIPDIARELSVDAVLEGSVLRSGDKVRIHVQLIATAPERHLWANVYERDLRDIMTLYAEVGSAVAAAVGVHLTTSEVGRFAGPPRVSPLAYEAWLRGSYHGSRWGGDDNGLCVRYGREAVAHDREFAPAYELLATCYNLRSILTPAPSRVMFDSARSAALQALQLDKSLPSAHAALGYTLAIHDWDWPAAERAYQRALALNPSHEIARHDLGWLLSWLGRFDEGLIHARRAQELNPVSAQSALRVGMILHLARRHDKALEEAKRAIEIDPTFMFAYDRLHWAYHGLGRYDDAVAAAERAHHLASNGDLRRKAFLAHAYAFAGRRSEAESIFRDLQAIAQKSYVPPTAMAAVYVGLGSKSEALDWLEKAYDERDADMVLLKTFPLWDPIRAEPRFVALLERMRFPP